MIPKTIYVNEKLRTWSASRVFAEDVPYLELQAAERLQPLKATAGYSEGTASKEVAKKIAPRLTGLRLKVLEAIRQAGAAGITGSEISEKLGIFLYTAKPRCSELHQAGYILKCGLRDNGRKNSEVIWKAAHG